MISHPRKPRLALSIGITGHRPNKEDDPEKGFEKGDLRKLSEGEVARCAERVLAKVKELLPLEADRTDENGRRIDAFLTSDETGAPVVPRLSLVSCLAQGSDQIVARIAQEQGYILEAVLPFAASEYEQEIKAGGSPEAFHEILDPLTRNAVGDGGEDELPGPPLELPGHLTDPEIAYDTANLVMLDHISLLIAVWDGAPAEGRGGTETVVAEAVRQNMPVIVIDASGVTAEPQLFWNGLNDYPAPAGHIRDLEPVPAEGKLAEVVEALVRPPLQGELSSLKEFYAETYRAWNFCLHWPALLAIFGVRSPRRSDIKVPPCAEIAAEASEQTGVRTEDLLESYAWADTLGTRYGQIFRSAFVLNFTLAGLAVFTVALSILLKDALHLVDVKWPFVLVEVVLIVWLLLNTSFGARWHWHRRWFESREVAERLRIALPIRRLAARPEMLAGPLTTWTSWYTRAVLRACGLPSGKMTLEDLRKRRGQLRQMLVFQSGYHAQVSHEMKELEHRMERTGEVFFYATLLVATLFVIGKLGAEGLVTDSIKYVVTALTAGFPVLGTAIYGIRVIGDFEGNSKRSKRIAGELDQLVKAIDDDEPDDLLLAQARARQASAIMMGDLESWRSSTESRKLAIPG